MKKLLLILFTVLTLSTFSQNDTITYPHFSVENGIPTVVFTIEQAQKIDNDEQLLKLFQQQAIDLANYDESCIKVVDAQGKEIAGLKLEITALKNLGNTKDAEITNLKEQIKKLEDKDKLSKEELEKKDGIIKSQKDQIRKQKFQKVIGFIGGGAAVIGLVILAIL